MSFAHCSWSPVGIDREPDDLHAALVELGLDPGHVAELGRADRREVLRVREQHRPGVADPVVEADRALRWSPPRSRVRCRRSKEPSVPPLETPAAILPRRGHVCLATADSAAHSREPACVWRWFAERTTSPMAAPDMIVLKRDRDLAGREWEAWLRRGLFALLCLVPLLALLNVFGQRPETASAAAPEAKLELYAPEHVRSGLLFEARFRVTAPAGPREGDARPRPGLARGDAGEHVEPARSARAARTGSSSSSSGTSRPATRSCSSCSSRSTRRTSAAQPGRRALRRAAQAGRAPPDDHGVSLMDIVVRAVVLYLFMLFVMRVIGRRSSRR